MPRIVRTRSSCADVLEIAAHIADGNLPAAERWLEDLDATLELLARYPMIGEQVDHLWPNVRRHCFGSYLLYYTAIEDGIELRRVLHGARNIETL